MATEICPVHFHLARELGLLLFVERFTGFVGLEALWEFTSEPP
jgi:hypothetical protein